MKKLFFILLLIPFFSLKAQDTLSYEISKGESLYKLHKIYEVSIEDLKKQNNLKNNIVVPGQVIKIYQKDALSKERIALNTLVYTKELSEDKLSKNEAYLKTELDSLSKYSASLDENTQIQEKFKIAKRKAFLKDSIASVNEAYLADVKALSKKIDESIQKEEVKLEDTKTKKNEAIDSLSVKEEEVEKPLRISAEERERLKKEKELALKEKAKLKKLELKEKEKAKKQRDLDKKKAKKLKEKEKKTLLKEKAKAKKARYHEKDLAIKEKEKQKKLAAKEKLKAKKLKEKEKLKLKKDKERAKKIATKQKELAKKNPEKAKALAEKNDKKVKEQKSKEEVKKQSEKKIKTKEPKPKKEKIKQEKKVSSAVIVDGEVQKETKKEKKIAKTDIIDNEKDEEAKIVIQAEAKNASLNVDSLKRLKELNEIYLDEKIEAINKQKAALDENTEMQEILLLSKQKFIVSDSIMKLNKKIDLQLSNTNPSSKNTNLKEVTVSKKDDESLEFDNLTKIDTSVISKENKDKFIQEDKENDLKEVDTIIDNDIKITSEVGTVVINKDKKRKKYQIGDIVERQLQEKARFYLSRAKLEIDKANISKAREYIDKSIKLNPSLAEAYMLKGDIYSSFTYYEKALNQYKKASFLEPTNAQLNYNIGNCFIRMGKDDLAIKEWTKAIQNDSTYILAYAGRASLLMKSKRFEEAIADYNKIFSINKFFYMAYKGRGVAHLELGNYGKAIIDFNNFLAYEPEDDFVILKRGMAKLSDNEIYGGCIDLLSSSEFGNKDAAKALKRHCEK